MPCGCPLMHDTYALSMQQSLPRVPREWMRRGLVVFLAVRTRAMWQCARRLSSPFSPVLQLRPDGFTGPVCCLLRLPRARLAFACDYASVCLSLVFVPLPLAWCVSSVGVVAQGASSLTESSSSHH